MKARYILAGLCGAIVLGNAPAIISEEFAPEASADVSAQCWAHLAEIPPGETPAGDVRYHRLKGEFSPCTEQEATEASQSSSDGSKDKDRDKKSRHCRKHWYC
ncbi:hypothetical protein SEA_JAAN_80 [Mycobacterium phage Jaan]|nr:hypothetical protein SEA_JAAN_80 [Mycobacterium phage Jaan]